MRLRHLQEFPNAPEPDADWPRFYADYPPKEFPARRFSDGGILDNKPFSYATGSLVGRRAPLPVDRKLIFVEPDPSTGAGEPPAKDWNGLQTAQAAVLTLPRAENIRGDLQAVLTREPRDRAGARHPRSGLDGRTGARPDPEDAGHRRGLGGLAEAVARPDDRAPGLGPVICELPPAQGARARRLPRPARRSRQGPRSRLGRVPRRALPRPRVEGLALRRDAHGRARERERSCSATSACRTGGAGWTTSSSGCASSTPPMQRSCARPDRGWTAAGASSQARTATRRSSSSGEASPPPRTPSTRPTASSPRAIPRVCSPRSSSAATTSPRSSAPPTTARMHGARGGGARRSSAATPSRR